jgi:hypothetical protein
VPFASCAASLQERLEAMPGDDLVADAIVCSTHAICIRTPPERVWPWLAQMGAGRGGWYSHDRLDNGGVPSAERLVPDLQGLEPGDVLPALPGAVEGFVVAALDPPRLLVLVWPAPGGGCTASWTFVLRPALRGEGTRLLVRARLSREVLRPGAAGGSGTPRAFVERIYRALPHVPTPIVRAMATLGHGFMQTKQLRGIKHRAESHASL